MMTTPRILWIESNRAEQLAVQQSSGQAELSWICEVAASLSDAREKLAAQMFDCVVWDLQVMDATASAWMVAVEDRGIPLVVIAPTGTEEMVVRLMQQGTTDFVMQDPDRHYLRLLPIKVQQAIEVVQMKRQLGQMNAQHQTDEEFLRAVIDAVPNQIFVKDREGRYLLANRKVASFYGTTVNELLGKRDLDFHLDAALVGQFVQENDQVIATRQAVFIPEEKSCNHRGEVCWLQWQKVPIQLPGQSDMAVLGVGTDISQHKQTLEKIAFQASLLEQVHNAVIATDLNGRIIYWNHYAEVLYQWRAEEVIGTCLAEVLLPIDSSLKAIDQVGQSPFQLIDSERELEVYCKDDTCLPIQITISPTWDSKGELNGYITVSNDMTDRRRSEADRRSQERLLEGQRQVLEQLALGTSLPDVLWLLVQTIDAQKLGQFGSILLLEGQHLWDGASPNLPPGYVQVVNGLEIGPQAGSCGTAAYRREPVVVVDIATDPLWEPFRDIALQYGLQSCWSVPILTRDGEVLGTFALYHQQPYTPTEQDWKLLNIATYLAALAIDRKRTELALLQSENRFRATFEQAAVGICHVNLDGRFLRFNQRFCEICGYLPHHLESLTFQEITYPDDLPIDLHLAQQLLRGNRSTYRLEKRYIRHDRNVVWANLTVSIIQDSANQPDYFIAVIEDITDRKQAEAALHKLNQELEQRVEARTADLQQSNRQLQDAIGEQQKLVALVENSLDFIAIATPQGKMTYVNRAGRQLVGLDETTDIGNYQISDFHFPQDWADLEANVIATLAQGNAWQGEVNLRHFQTQAAIPMLHSAFPITHPQTGEMLAVAGILRDMTAQKQVEDQLRDLSDHLTIALTAGAIGTWEWDIVHDRFTCDQRVHELYGIEPGRQPLNYQHWLTLVHPDDRSTLEGAVKKFLQEESEFDAEFRVVQPGGAVVFLKSNGLVQRNDQGEPLRVVGVNFDITPQKQIENQLYESRQFLQTVLDTFPQSVFWKDRHSRYLGSNRNFLRDAGLSSLADLVGKSDDEMPWGQIHAGAYRQADLQVMEQNQPKLGILETQMKATGEEIWVETNKLPLHNRSGEVIGILGTYQDITDRKLADQQLQHLSDRLNLALRSAPIGIWEWDIIHNVKIWDDTMRRLYGIDVGATGDFYQAWLASIHPDDRSATDDAIQQALQGAKEYDTEFRVVQPTGRVQHIKAYGLVQRNDRGEPQRMLGVNFDITERKEAEQQISDLSDRLSLALTCARIGIWEWDLVADTVFWDDRMYELYGLQRSDSGNTCESWLAAIHPDDRAAADLSLQLARRGELDYDPVFRVLHPDGSIHYIQAYALAQRNEQGEALRMIGVNLDITERKQTELALRESEERWQLALQGSNDGIWDWNLKAGAVFFSERWKKIRGLQEHEVGNTIGEWSTRIHPDDYPSVMAEMVKHFAGTTEFLEMEYRVHHTDGSYRWVLDRGKALRDDRGLVVRMAGSNTDISRRKQAEVALRESEERSRMLMEGANDAILISDTNGHFLAGNRKAEELLGYTREEISHLTIPQIHPSEELERHAVEFSNIVQRGTGVVTDALIQRKDGSTVPVDITSSIIEVGGKPIALGIFRDITDRKRAELENQQLRDRLQFVLSTSPAIIFTCKAEGDFAATFVSDNIYNITGYTSVDFLKSSRFWADHIHPDDVERVFTGLPQLFEQESYSHEYRFRHQAGHYVWMRNGLRLVRDAQGQPIEIVGYLADISDLKETEFALRDSEARFRTYFEQSLVGKAITSPDKGWLRVNDKLCEILGYSREELTHLTWAQITHPDDIAADLANFQQVLRGETDGYSMDKRFIRKDGSVIFASISARCVRKEDGTVDYFVAIVEDITARKQAEERLRESESSLLEAQRVAHIGNWVFDISTQTITWSEELYRMFGLNPLHPVPLFNEYLKHIHPEDRPILVETVERAISEGDAYTIDYRVLLPDGSLRYHEGRGETVCDTQGRVVKLYGTALDITDRKQTELELRQNRDLREAIFEKSTDALFIVDPTTDLIVDCNQRAVQMFEAEDKSELVNVCGNSLQRHPFSPQALREIIAELTTKGFWSQEIEYVTRREQTFWANIAGTKISVADKDVRLVRLSDITPRKQIELLLHQQLEKEQLLVSVLTRIRDSLDLSAILQIAVNEVRDLIESDRVLVYQIHEDGTGLAVAESIKGGWRRILDRSFPAEAFPPSCYQRYIQGIPCIINDWQQDSTLECMIEFMQEFQIQAKLVVPIVQQENKKLWGLLIAHECSRPRHWEAWEIGLLQQLAGQLAIAIQQADLYQQIQSELAERQRAEARLQMTNEQLQLANSDLARATRLKDEFLASMSHELRTPLNAILGMSEALQEQVFGGLNQHQEKAVHTIADSGRHLLDLINDILDLAKIEAGKLELSLNTCSVQTLCYTSLTLVKQMAFQKRIQLNTLIAPHLYDLEVDDRRMRQAIVNLLSNAIKFTPEGGSVTLEVWSQSAELPPTPDALPRPMAVAANLIFFSILDTGIGIAPEDISKLFQSFVQIDSSLNRQYSGTGLGLALVKRITELHGGWVQVKSRVGLGSRFTIVLPYPAPAQPAGNSLGQSAATTIDLQPQQWVSPPISDRPPLILLAEDNQANVETYSNYLISYGYRLVVADNGLEAVTLAQQHQPDIILMDIQMPEMDGLEAARRIRAMPELSHTPILALTALAMPGDREKCFEAGINEYLTKPVRLRHLVEQIAQLLHL